jgi:hypothetical protein
VSREEGSSLVWLGVAIALRTIEPQRWGLVILEALLASGISYLVFEIWLQAQLPRGVFPL